VTELSALMSLRGTLQVVLLLAAEWSFVGSSSAQVDGVEIRRDTVVHGFSYELICFDANGRVIAFGHRDSKGRKHGRWCELRGTDDLRMEGEYFRGKRAGIWWMNDREFFKYNDKGKIMVKGSGSRGSSALPF
jgi:hypothetical protein